MKNFLPIHTGEVASSDLFEEVQFLFSETEQEKLTACAAEVAFVGRSNVGKSTLINALCRKDVARISSTPGRTRTINVYSVGRDRWLVDLPGYGFAHGPRSERDRWGPMIENYLTRRPALRMIFVLIDAKVGPTRLDLKMFEWLKAKGLPYRPLIVKADQVKNSRIAGQKKEIASALGLKTEVLTWISSDKSLGIDALRAETAALLKR